MTVRDQMIGLALMLVGIVGGGLALLPSWSWPGWWALAPATLGAFIGLALVALHARWVDRREVDS